MRGSELRVLDRMFQREMFCYACLHDMFYKHDIVLQIMMSLRYNCLWKELFPLRDVPVDVKSTTDAKILTILDLLGRITPSLCVRSVSFCITHALGTPWFLSDFTSDAMLRTC